jgi:hypothetical protein
VRNKLLALLLLFATLLGGCASINDEEGAYLRVSQGSYGAKLLQWLGLAAEGEYCQISSNELGYEWTSEDLAFFTESCDDNARELIQQLLDEQ